MEEPPAQPSFGSAPSVLARNRRARAAAGILGRFCLCSPEPWPQGGRCGIRESANRVDREQLVFERSRELGGARYAPPQGPVAFFWQRSVGEGS